MIRAKKSTKASGSSSLARSSAVMAAGTLASRVLGLVRNALLVVALGATASGAVDAFTIANTLPTQMYGLLVGGILNAILVPQIVRALRQRNGEELVNRLLTAASMTMLVITAVLTVASPLVIMFYASGLGRWQPLAFAFSFWCMPQVFFYGLYALWGQVLNARSSFGPYMWSPVLNNIISIASLAAYIRIYGSYHTGQDPQVWDAARIALVGATSTLGIAAQALVLYIPLIRSGFRPRLVFGLRGMGLGSASKVALWALLGVFIVGLGEWATTNLGSRAVTAAETSAFADTVVPSTTMYANAQLVYMLPQSLVTTSIITALFTRMSEKAAADDAEGVRDDLSLGLRSVAVFTILFAAGIGTLAAPALQLFVPSISLAEARASAPILTVLAVGIIFQGVWFTTQRVMLAYADTKRLLLADLPVGMVPVLVCAGAYFLAPANHWMTWAAVGSVLSQIAGTVAIIPLMRRHLPNFDARRIAQTYGRLLLAAVPAVLVGLGVRRLHGPADGSLTGTRAVDAVVTVLTAALLMTMVYLAVAGLLRVSELAVLFRPLSSLLSKVARYLPAALGRPLERLADAIRPAPPSGEAPVELPPSFAPAYWTSPATWAASLPETGSRVFGPAPPPTLADLAAVSEAVLSAAPGTLTAQAHGPWSAGRINLLTNATPIGSGRFELVSPLPATLPRIVRHVGRDTILDREVTVLVLTAATPHRREVLEAASRAVLVEDPRIQGVYDVETTGKAFIVTEPTTGRTLSSFLSKGMTPAQVRAVVGEVAQALDACSRRGLHHLNLSPDAVRLRPDGTVQVSGVGVEAAALGLDAEIASDPLAADRTDAKALVELLYYGLTKRWPGKRSGIVSAPMVAGGRPMAPSELSSEMEDSDADLDALVERTWSEDPPSSAGDVARSLEPWDTSCLPTAPPPVKPEPAPVEAPSQQTLTGSVATATLGVLARLRRMSTARPAQSSPAPAPPQDAPVSPAPTPGGPADAGPESAAPAGGAPDSAAPATDALVTPGAEQAPVEQVAAVPSPAEEVVTERPTPTPSPVAPETSSSMLPVSSGSAWEDDSVWEEDEQDRTGTSRSTMLVLLGVLAFVLLLLFLAIANLLQLAGVRFSEEDVPAAQTVPTTAAPAGEGGGGGEGGGEAPAPAAPIVIAGAQSLDPFGDNNEHPELEHLLVDGSTEEEWYSRFYTSATMDGKAGIGAAVTLEQAAQVSGIDLQGTGSGGNVQIRATSPDDPTGGTVLAEGPFTQGTTSFSFTPTSTQSIVVWVTELPIASDGQNKLTISEITLR